MTELCTGIPTVTNTVDGISIVEDTVNGWCNRWYPNVADTVDDWCNH
jgi:hypothetical protein